MSWWNNVVNAVQSYFSPKTTSNVSSVQNSSPVSTMSSVPGQYNAASKSYNAPLKTTSYSSPVSSSRPSYSSGGSSVPSNSSAPQPSISDGIPTNIQNAKSAINRVIAPVVGKAGKALTTVGTALNAPQLKPGGLGAAGQDWAGFQEALKEAEKGGFIPQLPEAFKNFSESASEISPEDVWNVFSESVRKAVNPQWGKSTILNPNLYQYLQNRLPANVRTGAAINLPGAAKTAATGQILPTAAATGAPAETATSLIAPPIPSPRGAVVPSAVQPSTLPANMQNLTPTNVNVPLAKAITPEAIQSIGQLLLQSLLGNQSTLTSMSPGIASALWGAPTAGTSFGGYEGGTAVPSQTSIKQPKNLPPLPAVLNKG